jgi:hypothetical protein
MTTLTERDTKHVFEKLRAGLVPERALDSYAVGIDKELGELDRQFGLVESGEGACKFLRGDYGCGKTFVARLAIERAQARGFATSFVVVSPNDLKFHRFDEVYNKVVSNLATATCERQALSDILDRWIGGIEDKLVSLGIDEDRDDFDAQVASRIAEDLASLTNGKVPADFVRVVQTIFALKQQGQLAEANTLISWLSGSHNIDAGAKRHANIKGEVGSRDAMDYMRGVVEIVRAAGYRGLLIVIDEAETIIRQRSDSRHKSLNGIRQIVDAAGSYPRLLWLFTGTPDFFDSRMGVAGLAPLHDRLQFQTDGEFASRRQPQLQLRPFDRQRLIDVSKRLRALYVPLLKEGAKDSEVVRARVERHRDKISDEFIAALVDSVSAGFGGDVGVVPRQYLRKFVNTMDILRDEDDGGYDPLARLRASGYVPQNLTPPEQAKLHGEPPLGEDGDALTPVEDAW